MQILKMIDYLDARLRSYKTTRYIQCVEWG